MATLEFFFDVSSPWTYLAFSRVEELARATDAELLWRPILVGGVFNRVNTEVYERRARPHRLKARYAAKDLQDWARHCGLEIGSPPVFPVRAVAVMRGAVAAAEQGRLPAYARAAFCAYWGRLEDISQPPVLDRICSEAGLDPEQVRQRSASQDVKDRLRANTEELMERGGFGSPTMFVDRADMYFGNDRLPLVEAALRRGR